MISLMVSTQQNHQHYPNSLLWSLSCHSQIIFLPSSKLESENGQMSLVVLDMAGAGSGSS